MNTPDRRIYSLQAFRALAVILVVFNHATVLGREALRLPEFANASAMGLPEIANTFFFGDVRGSIRVDVFFVLSGFMIFYTYKKYLGDGSKIRTYLIRRCIRIYPLLWTFTLAKIGLILAHPGRAKPYETSPSTMIASLLALPQDNLPLIAATWTLSFEMVFYLLFGLAICIGGRRAMVLAAVWVLAIIVTNVAPVSIGESSLSPPHVLSYLLYERNLEFLLGCVAAYMVRRGAIRRSGLLIALGVLGLTFSCFLIASGYPVVSYTLLVGLPSAMLIAGTASLELERRPRVPRLFTCIGDASYSIFVSHSTFLNLCVLPLALSGPWPVGPVYVLLAMTAFAILGGIVVYHLVEQPLQIYLRRKLLESHHAIEGREYTLPQADHVPITVR